MVKLFTPQAYLPTVTDRGAPWPPQQTRKQEGPGGLVGYFSPRRHLAREADEWAWATQATRGRHTDSTSARRPTGQTTARVGARRRAGLHGLARWTHAVALSQKAAAPLRIGHRSMAHGEQRRRLQVVGER